MYKLIVRNQKETGQAIFYDPKKSTMRWHLGGSVISNKIIDIEINDKIKDFINSLETKRPIESLLNYKNFREECMYCPVVQLCKGITDDDDWIKKCNQAYAENIKLLYLIILLFTGNKLETIQGQIRRPYYEYF